jgi:hypothetical protein
VGRVDGWDMTASEQTANVLTMPRFGTRRLAEQWAEEERKILEQER